MKKLIVLLLFVPLVSFGQTFKEIEKFHKNGNTAIEVVKNSDLIIIQRNSYAENGTLISQFSIDPENGLLDGDFVYNELSKDGEILNISQGYLDRGLLNCNKCTIKVDLSNVSDDWIFSDFLNPKNEGIKFQGKFVDGKPVGKISVFEYIEETTRSGVDIIGTNINARLGSADVAYFYRGTGKMYKIPIGELNYNNDGYLDGLQFTSTGSYPPNWGRTNNNYKEIIYKNGIPNELYIREEENNNIYKDSIIRNSKIWKIDGKYVRNNGRINFDFNEFDENFYMDYGGFEVSENNRYRDINGDWYSLNQIQSFEGELVVNLDGFRNRINASETNNILGIVQSPNFNFVGTASDLSYSQYTMVMGDEYKIFNFAYQPILIMGGYIEGGQKNGLRSKSYNVTNTAERLTKLFLPITLNEENLLFKNYLIYNSDRLREYGLAGAFIDTYSNDFYVSNLNEYLKSISPTDDEKLQRISKVNSISDKNKEELNFYRTLGNLTTKSYDKNNFFFKEYINTINEFIDSRKTEILDVIYYNVLDKTFISYKDFHLNQLNKIDSQILNKAKSDKEIQNAKFENKVLDFENLLNTLNDNKVLITPDYTNKNLGITDIIEEILKARNLREIEDKQKDSKIAFFLRKFPPNSVVKGVAGIQKIINHYNIIRASKIISKKGTLLISPKEFKSIDFYCGVQKEYDISKRGEYIEINLDLNERGVPLSQTIGTISTTIYTTKSKIKNSLFSFDAKILKEYVTMPGFCCFKLSYEPNQDKFYLKAFQKTYNAKMKGNIKIFDEILKEFTIGEVIVPGLDTLPSN